LEKVAETKKLLIYCYGLRRTGLNAGSAICTLLFIHHGNLFIVQGNGLFGALLDTRSAAYALLSIYYCWHYEILQFAAWADLPVSRDDIYLSEILLSQVIVPFPVLELLSLCAIPAANGLKVSCDSAYMINLWGIAVRASLF
jgi:hypothetical protein